MSEMGRTAKHRRMNHKPSATSSKRTAASGLYPPLPTAPGICLQSLCHLGAVFNKGPFGGHQIGGEPCPSTALEVVPH